MQSEVFIDVRTKGEWDEGHHHDALHFDLEKIMQGHIPPLAKDTPIALYCRSGSRAGIAQVILQQQGFIHVRNAGAFDAL
jgi:rhodanese-related sulfurtransferase